MNMPDFGTIFFISYDIAPDGTRSIEWVGSAITWGLLCMSMLGIALIVETMRANARRSFRDPHEESAARNAARGATDGQRAHAAAGCAPGDSDLSCILRAAAAAEPLGHDAMLLAAEEAAEARAVERLRRAERLHLLAQVSPMVGLFGTVYGMILSFWSIATSGGNADPVLLAGGIGTALVTTFWGLVVAIPSLAAYASLRARIDLRSADALQAALAILARG